MQFQVLTVVRLMTPDPRPPDGPTTTASRPSTSPTSAGWRAGKIAVNGPIGSRLADWRG